MIFVSVSAYVVLIFVFVDLIFGAYYIGKPQEPRSYGEWIIGLFVNVLLVIICLRVLEII